MNFPKLKDLKLEGNPLTCPPPEIAEQGWESIKAHLSDDLKRVWRSKLMVIGEGGVGKTNLLRRLRREAFDPKSETTHGMERGRLELPRPLPPPVDEDAEITMQLSTWDFGGQEIYHATHQFFLTERSLYLVVWNARLGHEQGRLNYWLDTIKSLTKDAPVILVATHTDERQADLPLAALLRDYPNIVESLAVSNLDSEAASIDRLRDAIARAAAGLPLMGEYWPVKWRAAADAIQLHARTQTHVSPEELATLMADRGVAGIAERVLTKWLHELGEILYFRDEAELDDRVILDPQWVTETISLVLECEQVRANHAILTRERMDELWQACSRPMREHLLRLMEKFDLSHRTLEDHDKSLVVELLPHSEADYHGVWNALRPGENCREIKMLFRLSQTMPAGVPTWFIARQHRFNYEKTHWRYGTLMADQPRKNFALLQAFPHNRYLELSVRGSFPQNLFALLRDGLELTLNRFKGLEYSRGIPCPGPDAKTACPHEFDYDALVNRLALTPPRLRIECEKCYADLSVRSLLDGIWSVAIEEQLERMQDTAVATQIGVEAIRRQQAELVEIVQREFTKLFTTLQSHEETECPSVFILRDSTREGDLIGLFGAIRSPGMLERIGETLWKRRVEIQLYCQMPGCWHPTGCERGRTDAATGLYQIEEASEFLQLAAPYVAKLAKVMKFALPLAGPFASAFDAEKYEKQFKQDIASVTKFVDKFDPKMLEGLERQTGRFHDSLDPQQADGAALRALRKMLDKDDVDPYRAWGGLKKVTTKEGHILWLCPDHAAEYRR